MIVAFFQFTIIAHKFHVSLFQERLSFDRIDRSRRELTEETDQILKKEEEQTMSEETKTKSSNPIHEQTVELRPLKKEKGRHVGPRYLYDAQWATRYMHFLPVHILSQI